MDWRSLSSYLCVTGGDGADDSDQMDVMNENNEDQSSPETMRSPVMYDSNLSSSLPKLFPSHSIDLRTISLHDYGSCNQVVSYFCSDDLASTSEVSNRLRSSGYIKESDMLDSYGLSARMAFLSTDVLRCLLGVMVPSDCDRDYILDSLSVVLSDPVIYEDLMILCNLANLCVYSSEHSSDYINVKLSDLKHLPCDVMYVSDHSGDSMDRVINVKFLGTWGCDSLLSPSSSPELWTVSEILAFLSDSRCYSNKIPFDAKSHSTSGAPQNDR